MKLLGNRTAEDGACLRVDRLQGTNGSVNRNIACHEKVLIENKFYFVVSLPTPMNMTGTGMDFDFASCTQTDFRIDTGAPHGTFCYVFFTH